jgi:hypothetical protein
VAAAFCCATAIGSVITAGIVGTVLPNGGVMAAGISVGGVASGLMGFGFGASGWAIYNNRPCFIDSQS